MYVCVYVRLGYRSGHAIMIGSSTYVGMITVGRAEQPLNATSDMITREVGRDRLVRARLSIRESSKRREEEEVNNPFNYRYIIT